MSVVPPNLDLNLLRVLVRAWLQEWGIRCIGLTKAKTTPDDPDALVHDPSGKLMDFMNQHGAAVMVLLPDHHVYGSAASAEQCGALIDDLARDRASNGVHTPAFVNRVDSGALRSFLWFLSAAADWVRGCELPDDQVAHPLVCRVAVVAVVPVQTDLELLDGQRVRVDDQWVVARQGLGEHRGS
jgi:hypothetical protein